MNVCIAIHTVTERVNGKQVVTEAGKAFVPNIDNESYFLSCGAIRRANESEKMMYEHLHPTPLAVDTTDEQVPNKAELTRKEKQEKALK